MIDVFAFRFNCTTVRLSYFRWLCLLIRVCGHRGPVCVCLVFWLQIATEPTAAFITKTYLYNFDPLNPHFYIVKLGFIGVYIIFLISAQNIDCGYSLEPPRRGGSNEYPQSMFWAEIRKISDFLSENLHFLVVELSVYLNSLVFVMVSSRCLWLYVFHCDVS